MVVVVCWIVGRGYQDSKLPRKFGLKLVPRKVKDPTQGQGNKKYMCRGLTLVSSLEKDCLNSTFSAVSE